MTFNTLAKYYDNFFIQLIFKFVHFQSLKFIKGVLKPNMRVLDLGCGTGNFLLKLKQLPFGNTLKLFGADESHEMLERAREKDPEIYYAQSEADDLLNPKNNFQEGTFDFIFIVEAFHHFQNHALVLEQAYRLLAHNGFLFVFDFSLDRFFARKILRLLQIFFSIERGTKYFYSHELKNLLQQTGYQILQEKIRLGNILLLAKK